VNPTQDIAFQSQMSLVILVSTSPNTLSFLVSGVLPVLLRGLKDLYVDLADFGDHATVRAR
jgi:hypothetical protein